MAIFKIKDGRSAFWQWDLDRKLIVGDDVCGEVHFCNGTYECSLVCNVYEQDGLRLVNVPNILLQTDRPISVYAYVKNTDGGYTKRSVLFSVRTRTQPADYVYTETQVKNWADLERRIKALEDSSVENAEIFMVTINEKHDGTYSVDKTPKEIFAAFKNDIPIHCHMHRWDDNETLVPVYIMPTVAIFSGYFAMPLGEDSPTQIGIVVTITDSGVTVETHTLATKDEIPVAVEEALTQAKESGAFDDHIYSLIDAKKPEIVEAVLAVLPESGESNKSFELIYENTIDGVTALDEIIEGLSGYKRLIVYFEANSLTENISINGLISGQGLFYYEVFQYSAAYTSDSAIVEYEFLSDTLMLRKRYNANDGTYNRESTGIKVTNPSIYAGNSSKRTDKLTISCANTIPRMIIKIWGAK